MRHLGLDDLDLAAILLEDGLLVAIPPDPLDGLAARVDDPRALDRLYVAKGRPETKPLPVLVADPSEALGLFDEVPAEIEALAARHWPGALTIVAACDDELASRVHATDRTVGIRCPDDPTARALLKITGPLCVTSANHSGEAPCRSADEVIANLSTTEAVVAVLDAGRRNGEPSTVVRLSDGELRVLRQGGVQL